MAFDTLHFTIAANGVAFPGIRFFSGGDHGAQYIGAHLTEDSGQVMVDQQRVQKQPDGTFNYFATFHNMSDHPIGGRLTGGGFV